MTPASGATAPRVRAVQGVGRTTISPGKIKLGSPERSEDRFASMSARQYVTIARSDGCASPATRASSAAAIRQRLSPGTTTCVRASAGAGVGRAGRRKRCGRRCRWGNRHRRRDRRGRPGGRGRAHEGLVRGGGGHGRRRWRRVRRHRRQDDRRAARDARHSADPCRRQPQQRRQAPSGRMGARRRAHEQTEQVPPGDRRGEAAGPELGQAVTVLQQVLQHAGTLRDDLRLCQVVTSREEQH